MQTRNDVPASTGTNRDEFSLQHPNGNDRVEPGALAPDAIVPNAAALRLKENAYALQVDADAAGTGTTDGGLRPVGVRSVAPSGMPPPPSDVTMVDVTAADPGMDDNPPGAPIPIASGTQPGDCTGLIATPEDPMISIAELKTSDAVPGMAGGRHTVLAPMGSPCAFGSPGAGLRPPT